MIKTAVLNLLKFTRFKENDVFYLTENEDLTLSFSSDEYNIDNAIIHLKNGKTLQVFTLKDGKITLNKDSNLLKVGRLDVLVDLPNICKTWVIDGIKIRETDSGQVLALSSLRDEYEKEITLLKERVKNLEKEREITL